MQNQDVILALSHCATSEDCTKCPLDSMCKVASETGLYHLVHVPDFLLKEVIGMAKTNKKCACYTDDERCLGTKEIDNVSCDGDERKCIYAHTEYSR